MNHTRICVRLACAAIALASESSFAVVHGFDPTASTPDNAVVNPFNQLPTNAWKLVGKYYGEISSPCGATQISREWILTANHCVNPTTYPVATFQTFRGTSAVKATDCVALNGADTKICRLSNPENISAPAEYPPLAALPAEWRNAATPRKYGSVMVQGYGSMGAGLAFVGLDSFTVKLQQDGTLLDFEPTTYAEVLAPYYSGGDSGGTVMWFPPNAARAHLVGNLKLASAPLDGAELLTSTSIGQIVNVIRQRGDTAPAVLDVVPLVSPPPGERPPTLPAPPTLARVGSTDLFNLSWSTPNATPAVSSFQISVGEAGKTISRQNVSSGSTTTSITLPAKRLTLCVRPFNALGGSAAARNAPSGEDSNITSPNCLQVDNRLNLSAITNLVGQTSMSSGSLSTVVFTWGANASPADLALAGYRIQQSVTISGSLTRTGSATTVTSNRAMVSAPTGSRVCLNVSSSTANGKLGPMASACTTAR